MFIYAKAVCIHIFLICIVCRIYGTFQTIADTEGWTSWEHYAACSTTCVKGYENQTRACCDTGNNFLCYTIPWKNLTQYVGSCPVNGRWTSWSTYSICDVSCGNGTQFRKRTCEYPDGLLHGSSCFGDSTQSKTCNEGTCPEDGQWSAWTSWSHCTVTCGHGFQERTRVCDFLPDRPRGQDCANGEGNQTKSCTLRDCPVDGVWLQWSSWSPCSVTCGNGTRDRQRRCYFQPRVPQGEMCHGSMFETDGCNHQTCPVDGVWLQWSSWSPCSVTCGNGTRDRHRDCHYQPRVPQGEPCPGARNEMSYCNMTCPRSCYQFTKPVSLCEMLNAPQACPIEKQYCINTIDNKEDGNRIVEMRCGTRQECESGWFTKYSSNDRCTRFDENFVYTNKFYCEFCCATNDCNSKVNPDNKWGP